MDHYTPSPGPLLCVYQISNTVNDKLYVGITTRGMEVRLHDHLRSAKTVDTPLYRAMRKYGAEEFRMTLLEVCPDVPTLYTREQYWIAHLHTKSPHGYNLTKGGDGILEPSPVALASLRAAMRQASDRKRTTLWPNRVFPRHDDPVKQRTSSRSWGKRPLEEERRAAQERFLRAFADTGKVRPACAMAQIHRSTIYYWLQTDEAFKARYTTLESPNALRCRPPTEAKQATFLNAFAETANIYRAARTAGVHRDTVYEWLDTDAAFHAAYQAIERQHKASG